MDEMWQRHKTFILQATVVSVVFLIAFFVMRSMYGDNNDPEHARVRNSSRLKELEAKSNDGHAPSAETIATQRGITQRAEATKRDFVKRVASIAGRDAKLSESQREPAYVRENIEWIAGNIGRPNEAAAWEALFAQVPQACLSKVRDAARSHLVGKAAQSGKEIDETLGMSAGFAEDEIPAALQGLAVVTEVVGRCLAKPGIDKVQAVRVSPTSKFPEMGGVAFVSAIAVHMEIYGQPSDVAEVIRSFNSVGKPNERMTVLESVEYVVPMNPDEDTVRAAINVVGLRLKAEVQAEGK